MCKIGLVLRPSRERAPETHFEAPSNHSIVTYIGWVPQDSEVVLEVA